MSVPFSDLQNVAPSAIIELFQLQLNTAQHGTNDIYYFHAGVNLGATGNIFWDAQEYTRFPIEATDFEYNGSGQLPRPKLRVSNIFGTITALLLTLPNGLEGAKVTRIRTLARYIDAVNFPGGVNPTADPTAEFPKEIYYVDRKVTENRDIIEFELAAAFDLAGVRAPKRQCISNICQWKYRGPECGYTGTAYFDVDDNAVPLLAQDVCGKRLRSCELRFGQLRRTGSVTTGSNVLTLTHPTNFNANDSIRGFGVPTGATVSSVVNNLVTMSANATATTTIITTGTIQSNLTQIIVSSATGLAPGMTVTGPYLDANTQVIAIAGTTVTIGTPADPMQLLTLVATKFVNDGRIFTKVANSIPISPAGRTGLAVGQYVSSSLLPISRRAQISHFTTGLLSTIVLTQSYYKALGFALVTWNFYAPAAAPSATYTFTATNQNYTFRDDLPIPYGSFPGVGSFAQ